MCLFLCVGRYAYPLAHLWRSENPLMLVFSLVEMGTFVLFVALCTLAFELLGTLLCLPLISP